MSPRPGGEADKFGNRYEGAWTVQHVLRVLSGAADCITVEDAGELADGAEFTFRYGEVVQVHQVKRQIGNMNSWTPKSLHDKGIWENAQAHVVAGRRFHFVSVVPARPLQELADRARRSSDLASFINDWLTNELQAPFNELASTAIFGDAELAWTVLRGFWIECPDERNINDMNAAVAGMLLEGATGRLAAVGLGDLVSQNLGVRLDSAAIEARLPEYGLRRQLRGAATIAEGVAAITTQWTAGIGRELLRPAIPRAAATRLVGLLDGEDRLLLLTGDAGDGKSAVLQQVADKLSSKDVAVLGFRLDRLEPFSSTTELGEKLGLTVSPVSALSVVAGEHPSVLVIDQLDAVSLASGRMPQSFEAIADAIREASAFTNMRVLLACRRFDAENDHRIRELVKDERSARVEVEKLSDSEVTDAVRGMNLDPTVLSTHQRELLRSPLHLVLLDSVADEADALTFRTPDNLFDAFWERKMVDCSQRRRDTRFTRVIETVANAISFRQSLSVNASTLDKDDLVLDASVLISEHVLTKDGRQIAFFHEAFFGYVFARGWINRNQTLVDFLLAGEQELFRRSQVRQILSHLRTSEPERFVIEVEDLLTHQDVRFHVKDVVLGILRSLPDPTSAEWDMVTRVLEARTSFEDRVWLSLRTLPWFERLDAEGMFEEWLASSDERDHNHAMTVALGGIKDRPDRMAELLRPHASRAPSYANWLLWTLRFANVHESRPLFELLVDAIRSGEVSNYDHSLRVFTHDLADHQPVWAAELLAVHLVLQADALTFDDSGRVACLLDRDHTLIRLTTRAADGAPRVFCEMLVPYLLTVMRLTERPWEDHLLSDAHFSARFPQDSFHQLEDALLFSTADALRTLAGQDPEAARPLLEMLAGDQHEAAQWLLYEGLRGRAAEHYAEWAAALLLESPTRYLSGYVSNGVWTTRQLIEAIDPHLSLETFGRLEHHVLGLGFPWEKKNPGYYQFCLLSAMDPSRLSPAGARRLGELKRLIGTEQPDEPEPIEMHAVQSPIPPEAAQYMSDDDWLRAIAKHKTDREDFQTFRGGSRELSNVLKEEVANAPARFAKFALRLTDEVNPAYSEAILMGLGQAQALSDPTPIFAAMRHVASLRLAENDRWLGWPVRQNYLKSEIPVDIISTMIDLALNAKDPAKDRWPDQETEGGRETLDSAIFTEGINTTRGSLALTLSELLVYDPDGSRTALVLPVLRQMAQDPSIAVRSCVANVVAACLRHARAEAVQAFELLIQGDDRLLAVRTVQRAIKYIGNGDPNLVLPLIPRMLGADAAEVRQCGGALAAFAGTHWGEEEFLTSVVASSDAAARRGAAAACAHLLPLSNNPSPAEDALRQLVNDNDETYARGQQKSRAHSVTNGFVDSPVFCPPSLHQKPTPMLYHSCSLRSSTHPIASTHWSPHVRDGSLRYTAKTSITSQRVQQAMPEKLGDWYSGHTRKRRPPLGDAKLLI